MGGICPAKASALRVATAERSEAACRRQPEGRARRRPATLSARALSYGLAVRLMLRVTPCAAVRAVKASQAYCTPRSLARPLPAPTRPTRCPRLFQDVALLAEAIDFPAQPLQLALLGSLLVEALGVGELAGPELLHPSGKPPGSQLQIANDLRLAAAAAQEGDRIFFELAVITPPAGLFGSDMRWFSLMEVLSTNSGLLPIRHHFLCSMKVLSFCRINSCLLYS